MTDKNIAEIPMNRYARQIILPEIGEEGQRRLLSAKVAVVGAGGLGSPALYYLASAGIGHIHIIDADTLELTNLNRQFIHDESDIGREKSRSAKEKLERYNRDVKVSAGVVSIDGANARDLLGGYSAVLSCVDNKKTRYILNSACVSQDIPLIDGGVRGFEGYTLTVVPGVTPCYACVFPQKDGQDNAAEPGILGATAGVLGAMMAMETIKVLVGMPLAHHFCYVDLLSWRLLPIQKQKAENCPVCTST